MVNLLLKVNAQAYSVEAADVRHELDYLVWQDVKFPEGKIYIKAVAAVDCGFTIFAGAPTLVPTIAWGKLGALAEGARIASQKLWARLT
jgi:5-methyltetrahydropteroyltriglutamate--homocysteine methyltransferase